MTIDEFIAAQLKVIRDCCGFNEYLPTLWVDLPRQVNVEVLTDDLEADELETAVRDWAHKLSNKHDYFLAFKAGASHIKIVARINMMASERLVAID
jgi:hypothetical protein